MRHIALKDLSLVAQKNSESNLYQACIFMPPRLLVGGHIVLLLSVRPFVTLSMHSLSG
jgi:hypothetical protein